MTSMQLLLSISIPCFAVLIGVIVSLEGRITHLEKRLTAGESWMEDKLENIRSRMSR